MGEKANEKETGGKNPTRREADEEANEKEAGGGNNPMRREADGKQPRLCIKTSEGGFGKGERWSLPTNFIL